MKDGIFKNFKSKGKKIKEIIWLKSLILFLIIETTKEGQRNLINFSSEIHLVVSGGTQRFINNS